MESLREETEAGRSINEGEMNRAREIERWGGHALVVNACFVSSDRITQP